MTKIAEKSGSLTGMAELTSVDIARCFDTKRVFYLQLISESKSAVDLDENMMVPGCLTF